MAGISATSMPDRRNGAAVAGPTAATRVAPITAARASPGSGLPGTMRRAATRPASELTVVALVTASQS